MDIFSTYAKYYNSLYKDKDYVAETSFILNTLTLHGDIPKTLLDLGCGTGRHALEMARSGIAVTGVDISSVMLQMGQVALKTTRVHPSPVLLQGNACTVRLGTIFNSVTSLFHVMSYQNTEEEASALLRTAAAHLAPGSLFLFDFWHGAGVLADPPSHREKCIDGEDVYIRRTAQPVHRKDDHVVEVHYDIFLTNKQNDHREHFSEQHNMRYWFVPELIALAADTGFAVVNSGAWMQHTPVTDKDWTAWMLLRKLG